MPGKKVGVLDTEGQEREEEEDGDGESRVGGGRALVMCSACIHAMKSERNREGGGVEAFATDTQAASRDIALRARCSTPTLSACS